MMCLSQAQMPCPLKLHCCHCIDQCSFAEIYSPRFCQWIFGCRYASQRVFNKRNLLCERSWTKTSSMRSLKSVFFYHYWRLKLSNNFYRFCGPVIVTRMNNPVTQTNHDLRLYLCRICFGQICSCRIFELQIEIDSHNLSLILNSSHIRNVQRL